MGDYILTTIDEKMFKDAKFSIFPYDTMNVEYVYASAFENCYNLKELTFYSKLDYIDYDAFHGLKNCNIEFSSSFFKINWFNNSKTLYECYNWIQGLKSVKIYGHDFENDDDIKSIMFLELKDLLCFILLKYNIIIDDFEFTKYFEEQLKSMIKNYQYGLVYGGNAPFSSLASFLAYKAFPNYYNMKEGEAKILEYINEFYKELDTKLKTVKNSNYKTEDISNFNPICIEQTQFLGYGFTEFPYDTSKVEMISDYAFKNCLNLRKLKLYSSLRSICTLPFENCTNLELELKSSLFEFKHFGWYEDIRKLTVYGYDVEKTSLPQIVKLEIEDLLKFIFNKFKLEFNDKEYIKNLKMFQNEYGIYFGCNKMQLFDELANYIIKELSKKKAFLGFKTNGLLKKEILGYIDEFYKKLDNIKSKEEPILFKNNSLDDKSPLEIIEMLKTLDLGSLKNLDSGSIMTFGEELNPYLEYIANNFSKLVFENKKVEDRIEVIRSETEQYIQNNKSHDYNLVELNKVTSSVMDSISNEIKKIDIVRKLIEEYISKLEIILENLQKIEINHTDENIIKKLNNLVINSIINEIYNEKLSQKNVLIQEYAYISNIITNYTSYLTIFEEVESDRNQKNVKEKMEKVYQELSKLLNNKKTEISSKRK